MSLSITVKTQLLHLIENDIALSSVRTVAVTVDHKSKSSDFLVQF